MNLERSWDLATPAIKSKQTRTVNINRAGSNVSVFGVL